MRTAVIILIVLVILLIISAIIMNGSAPLAKKTNSYVSAAPKKNKVKFGNKVTRMDYDKETGNIIPGKIIERLNDTG